MGICPNEPNRLISKIAVLGPSELFLGNSVTVARLTLDQLVQVRILVPQFIPNLRRKPGPCFDLFFRRSPRENAPVKTSIAPKKRDLDSFLSPRRSFGLFVLDIRG